MIINDGNHVTETQKEKGTVVISKTICTSQTGEPCDNIYTAKLLMLGAAGSGKTTLVRHIRMIHGAHFTNEETLRFKRYIRSSCLQIFALFVSEYIDLQNTTSEWQLQCNDFLEHLAANENLDRELLDLATALWRDTAIQEYLVGIDAGEMVGTNKNRNFLSYNSDKNGEMPA